MRRVGRSDPCHRGSGIKYKYCCLQEDQEEANKSSASGSDTLAPSRTSSVPESRTLSTVEKAWDTSDTSGYEHQ